jgi:predicted nuclease of predicted toxin-antitoxin system
MIEKIKFLADVNIEKPIVEFLQENGYNTKWIPDLDCRMTDEKLLEMANKEKRILITNDKDFGELTFRQKRNSTGIILIRVKSQNSRDKVRLL